MRVATRSSLESETNNGAHCTAVQEARDRVRSRTLAQGALRSGATNSQARRFVIAIYDRGPRAPAAPSVSFPTGRALNGVLNNGFIHAA
jgi:hypothetical protein